MKKILSCLAVMACFMLCVLKVKADVIWEPYEDDFYMENRESCEYINRNYTADGPDGKVIVYKSPENPTMVETWENGYTVHIYYVCNDEASNSWGIYENFETDKSGWVPMAYMDVVYDYISFSEEFGESIVEENGTIPAEYAGKSIYCWSYPGAEKYIEIPMPEYEADMPQYSKTFIDEAGRKWGYIGYFRGTRNKWVCLNSAVADAADLYPDGLPERGTQETESNTFTEDAERITPAKDNGLVGLVTFLVVAVTGATGGILAWLKRGKK
ncbi:MAG: hypothetical protein IJZ82_01495 [Lachnospiraceae bacterium]|nr:hypothetical protein [Lachnospiraceae bacterium]